MPDPLLPIVVTRKSGTEALHFNDQPLPISLLSFWQWSTSDLVSNVTRGRFAEFIVASGLGIDVSGIRSDWDAFDLITCTGVKIEVKSAARVQSWFQSKHSKVMFRVPHTRAWDPETNRSSEEARRQADLYVLALLHHLDKLTVDPLNVAQWSFFVVPTPTLEKRMGSQQSISLSSLEAICASVTYAELATSVTQVANDLRASV